MRPTPNPFGAAPTVSRSTGADAIMSHPYSERAVDAAVVKRVLTDGDVEAIAEATATRLAEIVSGTPGTFALVDAGQLARDLAYRSTTCTRARPSSARVASGPSFRRVRLVRSTWSGSSRA